MTQLRQRMLEELQRRNYSQATTRSYIFAVKQFAEYFGRSPEKRGAEEIRRYQLYLLNVEIRMSALRFLYKKTLKRRDLGFDDLVYPKRPQRLPVVLSPEEVTRLIEATRTRNIRPSICTSRTVTCMRRSTRSINSRSNRRSQRINLSDPATLGGGRRHPHRWQ